MISTTTPQVNITPATPAQPLSPADNPITGQGHLPPPPKSAPVPVVVRETAIQPPASAPLPKATNVTDQVPLKATNPAASPTTTDWTQIKLPQGEVLILGALLLNLLFGRLPLLWTVVIAGGLYVYKIHATSRPSRSTHFDVPVRPSEGRAAVEWVNHALYALFPLISTDVLTPFIDLLEDALIQQVPPIVTSVRMTSASLGAQPVVLTSLTPMSDQEWFASLASSKRPSVHHDRSGVKSEGSFKKSHTRSTSASSRLSRTASGSSMGSAMDSEDVAQEAGRRRKRERILRRAARRRRGTSQNPSLDQSSTKADFVPRTGEDPTEESQIPDGGRHRGGPDIEMEQDDPNVGQFVNYQVGFEYDRVESTKRKGWGLHVLVSTRHKHISTLTSRYRHTSAGASRA